MKRLVLSLLITTACLASATSQAADVAALTASQCAACHGAQGQAPQPQWPHLAGQKTTYLADQLQAFRDGTRKDSLMSPVSSQLSDADIEALSAYYGQLSEAPLAPAADPASGRNTAATCTACHGARGISANDEWPNIAGQQAGYLEKQLRDYRQGRRESLIMSRVANGLSDSEIEMLASYFSTLDPRTARARQIDPSDLQRR